MVALPVVEHDAEENEGDATDPRDWAPIAAYMQSAAPEKLERRFASDHGKDIVVRQNALAPVFLLQRHLFRIDPSDCRRHARA